MGRFIFAIGCAAVICALTVFPVRSGETHADKNPQLYAGRGHGPGDGTCPGDGSGSGWKRGDCIFPDADMIHAACTLAKGGGRSNGGGNGGGHGPGDGTGNGGTGPKDGTGNGSKNGICINS